MTNKSKNYTRIEDIAGHFHKQSYTRLYFKISQKLAKKSWMDQIHYIHSIIKKINENPKSRANLTKVRLPTMTTEPFSDKFEWSNCGIYLNPPERSEVNFKRENIFKIRNNFANQIYTITCWKCGGNYIR